MNLLRLIFAGKPVTADPFGLNAALAYRKANRRASGSGPFRRRQARLDGAEGRGMKRDMSFQTREMPAGFAEDACQSLHVLRKKYATSYEYVAHWRRQAYRTQAYWITKAAEINPPAEGEIMLDVRFYPPANRGDTDGMFAACKSAFDGIADALEVNDRRFAFTIRRLDPVKNGAVFVTVQEAA